MWEPTCAVPTAEHQASLIKPADSWMISSYLPVVHHEETYRFLANQTATQWHVRTNVYAFVNYRHYPNESQGTWCHTLCIYTWLCICNNCRLAWSSRDICHRASPPGRCRKDWNDQLSEYQQVGEAPDCGAVIGFKFYFHSRHVSGIDQLWPWYQAFLAMSRASQWGFFPRICAHSPESTITKEHGEAPAPSKDAVGEAPSPKHHEMGDHHARTHAKLGNSRGSPWLVSQNLSIGWTASVPIDEHQPALTHPSLVISSQRCNSKGFSKPQVITAKC